MAKSYKRQIIEKEISKLVDFALENEINEEKIAVLAVESHEEYENEKKKHKKRFLLLFTNWKFMSLLFALLAICLTWGLFHRLLFFTIRFGLIKLLTFYDWTTFYKNGCVLENPFYKNPDENINCTTCEELLIIENSQNVSAKDIFKNNILANVPIIITDAVTDDWKAKKLFTRSFIFELFKSDDMMKAAIPCVLYTDKKRNENQRLDFIGDLISLLSTSPSSLTNSYDDEGWLALWENCNKSVVRTLRKYYKRPYFVHSSVEVAFVNWIMISTNHKTDYFIDTDIGTAVAWFVQLKGMTKIKLHPTNCNETCNDIYATVHEGETVLWTQPYWQFSYFPFVLLGDNISMMFGGFLD